jgi:copper chaperone
MQIENFTAQNIKCGGCVSTIQEGLGSLPGVDKVDVEIEGGKVTVTGANLSRSQISAKLKDLGYPEA